MVRKTHSLRLRIFLFPLFAVFLAGCSLHGGADISPHEYGRGVGVMKSARAQIGTKYKRAGQSPATGFDCSGLVWWCYDQHGISVPRITTAQLKTGEAIKKSQIRPGDILLFRINSKEWHSGIYSGGNKFIHSPKPGAKVREESLQIAYWAKRYYTARRPKDLRQ